ncbi:MAG: lysophospholipid acyltransferase family protein [Clostridiaceae bacterium]|nr:lysophospholipid acyltransferase family protein [Clostridiaceae bacterium]
MKPVPKIRPFVPSCGRLPRVLRWILYHWIAVPALTILDYVLFGLRIEGRSNLAVVKNRGAILVCNHIHYLDCTMIGCAAAPRQVFFASMQENFKLPVAGWFVRNLGCVSVGATLNDKRTFCQSIYSLLKQNKWVMIYPEGEMKLYGQGVRPFKPGAFHLAAQAGCPVVPLALIQRKPNGFWRLWKKRPLLTLVIGPPVNPQPAYSVKKKAQDLQERVETLYQDWFRSSLIT